MQSHARVTHKTETWLHSLIKGESNKGGWHLVCNACMIIQPQGLLSGTVYTIYTVFRGTVPLILNGTVGWDRHLGLASVGVHRGFQVVVTLILHGTIGWDRHLGLVSVDT